jgi:hypothetical protein
LAISKASCASFLSCNAVATVTVCPSTADWANVFSSSAVVSAVTALSYASEESSLASLAVTASSYFSSAIFIKLLNSSL